MVVDHTMVSKESRVNDVIGKYPLEESSKNQVNCCSHDHGSHDHSHESHHQHNHHHHHHHHHGHDHDLEHCTSNHSSSSETAMKNKELDELLKLISSIKNTSITPSSDLTSAELLGKAANASKNHLFWKTQPVPQHALELSGNEPIEKNRTVEQLRTEPYPLPPTYVWSDLDLLKPDDLTELYTLLSGNYVEDDDAMFRFDYPVPFLQWALLSPGWRKEWHVGVRVATTNKLVAFISAIPISGMIQGKEKKMVQVNFLCVHKKLRQKRLSPVLIKEITRRVNVLGNIFQAVYTAGVLLPQPIATCQYFHRPLNFRKLYDCGFTSVPSNSTLSKMIKMLELKPLGHLAGLRPLKSSDIRSAFLLVKKYLSQFGFYPLFKTEDEFAHWFLHRPNIVHSYVWENPVSKAIENFVSFYELPSRVLRQSKQDGIRTGYLFYYAVSDKQTIQPMMKSILLLAKEMGLDVFNCLDIMDNETFLAPLKFGLGDGQLRYYLFNWKTQPCIPSQIAFLMQ